MHTPLLPETHFSYEDPNVVYYTKQRTYIWLCQSPKVNHVRKIPNENAQKLLRLNLVESFIVTLSLSTRNVIHLCV